MNRMFIISYSNPTYCGSCSYSTTDKIVLYKICGDKKTAYDLVYSFRIITRFIYDNQFEFNMYQDDVYKTHKRHYDLPISNFFEDWWQLRFKDLNADCISALSEFNYICNRYKGSYQHVDIPSNWDVTEFDNKGYKI